MTTLFYRAHPNDAPPLSAECAWSAPWGPARRDNGSQYECVPCDATGEGREDCPTCYGSDFDCKKCEGSGYVDECTYCDGEGWIDCLRGYSCFEIPDTLIDYFAEPGRRGCADDTTVVVFEGYQADFGIDGEPTAVPTRVVETLPWAEFVARQQEVRA